jgi:hypothetical protein
MKINLTIGRTVNLGNYESLRVDVGAEIREDDSFSLKESIESGIENMYKELVTQLRYVINAELVREG